MKDPSFHAVCIQDFIDGLPFTWEIETDALKLMIMSPFYMALSTSLYRRDNLTDMMCLGLLRIAFKKPNVKKFVIAFYG